MRATQLTRGRRVLVVVGGAFLVGFPLIGGNFLMQAFIFIFAFAICAASWDIVFGYAGQINLGPSFSFGMGGFAVALLEIYTHLPSMVDLVAGAAIASGAGIVLAGPSLRLRGTYLAITTFVIALIAQEFAFIQTGEEGLTAARGLQRLFGGDVVSTYYLGFALLVISSAFMYTIAKSRVGMRLRAIGEDEFAARALGINVTNYKLLAFTINTFFTGLAGSYVTLFLAHVDYTSMSVNISFQIIAMTVVGGAGTIIGSILGAFILYLPTALLTGAGVYNLIVYGLLLVAVIVVAPKGLAPYISKFTGRRNGPNKSKT